MDHSLAAKMLQHRSRQSPHHLKGFPFSPPVNYNIVTKLLLRSVAIDSPAQAYHRERTLYQSIVPNYTESHIKVPSGFLRKFSPDGNFLLGFSSDQKSVVVYSYQGAGSGQELYRKKNKQQPNKDQIKLDIFDRFFRANHVITIPHTSENLNRECSLFTEDGQFVIVGSSVAVQDDPYPSMYEMFTSNEAVSANGRFQLEDYTLYSVDMRAGVVADSRAFKCNKIYLSHNQAISLCGSTLAILSTQQQTVYLFGIQNGQFIHLNNIGRFCSPDDPVVYGSVRYCHPGTDEPVKPFHEVWYNSLKHRLLCWLLADAERSCTPDNNLPVLNFFYGMDVLNDLRLWKMQLLSRQRLLLKFASQDVVTLKSPDPMSQLALIAVYNIDTTEFEAVFENTDEQLLRVYEDHADAFRVPISHPLSADVSSVSNDKHARVLHMKFKQTITNARYGGRMEATRRLLGQLPTCSQCHSSSPYLDLALFSYDDKWVSALERPRNVADSPVRYKGSCDCGPTGQGGGL